MQCHLLCRSTLNSRTLICSYSAESKIDCSRELTSKVITAVAHHQSALTDSKPPNLELKAKLTTGMVIRFSPSCSANCGNRTQIATSSTGLKIRVKRNFMKPTFRVRVASMRVAHSERARRTSHANWPQACYQFWLRLRTKGTNMALGENALSWITRQILRPSWSRLSTLVSS